MLDFLFGGNAPIIGTGISAVAMSEDQVKQMELSQAYLCAQAVRQADYWLGLQNYRPEVHVPEGFADWYACGDQLN